MAASASTRWTLTRSNSWMALDLNFEAKFSTKDKRQARIWSNEERTHSDVPGPQNERERRAEECQRRRHRRQRQKMVYQLGAKLGSLLEAFIGKLWRQPVNAGTEHHSLHQKTPSNDLRTCRLTARQREEAWLMKAAQELSEAHLEEAGVPQPHVYAVLLRKKVFVKNCLYRRANELDWPIHLAMLLTCSHFQSGKFSIWGPLFPFIFGKTVEQMAMSPLADPPLFEGVEVTNDDESEADDANDEGEDEKTERAEEADEAQEEKERRQLRTSHVQDWIARQREESDVVGENVANGEKVKEPEKAS